ncbi:hypothetical protein WG66_011333 [Moniliophthora roreri]|nr:hypothetical protein WG66_011333 [Moniliophthora roreri]
MSFTGNKYMCTLEVKVEHMDMEGMSKLAVAESFSFPPPYSRIETTFHSTLIDATQSERPWNFAFEEAKRRQLGAWRPKVKPGRKVSDDKTSVGPVEDKTRNEETFSSIPIIICGKLGSVTDNRRRRWAFVPTSKRNCELLISAPSQQPFSKIGLEAMAKLESCIFAWTTNYRSAWAIFGWTIAPISGG